MLAAKFVETEVKELLEKFELTHYEKSVLIALSEQIIKSYELYKSSVNGQNVQR